MFSRIDPSKDTCFVVMPFSVKPEQKKLYPNPKHWDHVYSKFIQPAVNLAELNCRRDDEDHQSIDIMRRVIRSIERAEIILCDLSGNNANVFFELGWAFRANKKVILIRDEQTITPFDLRNIQASIYSMEMSAAKRTKFISSLAERISAYLDLQQKSKTVLEDWDQTAASPQFIAKRCDVDIYYHRAGLTLRQAKNMAGVLRQKNIKVRVLEHDFDRRPDSLFIGSMVAVDDARDVYEQVKYEIKYLFRPDYPDSEGGDSDGSKIGVGYDSTYNISERDPVRSKPVAVTRKQLDKLFDYGHSNSSFQKLLWETTLALKL